MKNKVILISIMFFLSVVSYSQESFKKSLEAISNDLCAKMAEKGKKKVVVLFVTDINKVQTTAGKYMADVVSYYVVNNQNEFIVFDRENLIGIAEAKKLISEGYIDANNAQQLGKILLVDAIIIGNYTKLSNSISMTLKALDVNDGFVIAQSMSDITLDKDASILLGIAFVSENSNLDKDNTSTGSVNNDCETKNIGEYCFNNKTSSITFTINIYYQKSSSSYNNYTTIKVLPGDTQCIYDIPVGPHKFEITYQKKVPGATFTVGEIYTQGQINVEQCKSKTFVIK